MDEHLSVERTADYELIARFIRHPRVWPWVSDDGSGEPEDFAPLQSDAVIYILATREHPAGVFVFIPENTATCHVHTCLTPMAWGCSAELGRMALDWIFGNTQYLRVTTSVPAPNVLAARLAERVGMERYGVNVRSYLKGGVLHDQVLYGINKEGH